MATRKRRSIRQLEELPGLFDDITVDFGDQDPMRKILEKHRKEQRTAHGLNIDMDLTALAKHAEIDFLSFGSGSSGNCAYIGIPGQGGILVDAGVEADKVLDGLSANAIPLTTVQGLLLTHDHGDHVKYAYALLRKLGKDAKLYCTPRTINGILRRHSISRRIKDFHKPIYKEFAFQVGPFAAMPFEVSHDGTDNVGFCLSAYGHNFVVATDMGIISERADHYMRQANFLMIETNYDNAMLDNGTYPEYLKARIRGDRGHLANNVTAEYLASMWSAQLTDIYLCHLSHDNNRPELAHQAVASALASKGIKIGDDTGSPHARQAQVRVCVLPRTEISHLFVHRVK